MRKQYNDRSIYDNSLKQLDRDIIANRKRKNQTRSNLLWNIDSSKWPSKQLGRLKYVSSLGVFMVLLFLGYQLFASDIAPSNEQASTVPQDNQPDEFFFVMESESSEEEKVVSNHGDRTESIKPPIDIESIIPTYVPGLEHAPEPENVVEISDGPGYAYADYFHSDSHSFRVYLADTDVSLKDTIQEFKNQYKDEPIEEVEIAGHPSILRLEGEDIAHYSNLHIFTENYTITLATRGIEKEEILKSANSIDLTVLESVQQR